MILRLTRIAWLWLAATFYTAAGASVSLLVVGVLYRQSLSELSVWHLADLDEEFTETSAVNSFADYPALEERLFAQLHEEVYARLPANERRQINENAHSAKVVVRSEPPGDEALVKSPLALVWPRDTYSLAHIALPFAPDDPIYGGQARRTSRGIHLGDIALRGERSVLQIPAAEMLRLRWNPFFPYLEERVLAFVGLPQG